MKKFCITLELLIIILVTIACGTGSGVSENTEYLRIHIRANSNSDYDQSVKYKIRDEIVPYFNGGRIPVSVVAKNTVDFLFHILFQRGYYVRSLVFTLTIGKIRG